MPILALQFEEIRILNSLAIQNLQNAIKANVKIAFGTDSGVIPPGDNAKEFETLVKRGM